MTEDASTHPKIKTVSEAENEPIISDGYIIDCITGEKPLKDTVLATYDIRQETYEFTSSITLSFDL